MNAERQRTLADASGRKRLLVERIRTRVERRRMERGWNANDGRTQKERVCVKNDIFTVYLIYRLPNANANVTLTKTKELL